MWEVENKNGVERTKAEKIAGHTFDTVQNDAGVVVEVTDQFTTRKGFVETSIYSDPDANGLLPSRPRSRVRTQMSRVWNNINSPSTPMAG